MDIYDIYYDEIIYVAFVFIPYNKTQCIVRKVAFLAK